MPSVDTLNEYTAPPSAEDIFHFLDMDASGRLDRRVTFAWLQKWLDRPRFIEAAAPTVDDDETEGVAVGNRWLDTTGPTLYMCVDASEGAAVWEVLADWS